jgi:hypothetical protein
MPLKSQLHVDKLLSNVSVKYKNSEYIADEVFGTVNVVEDSNKYRVYARNFRIPETKRAQKAAAREHSFDVSTSSYILEDHALKDYVGDDEADNYDIADLRADTVEELTDVIMRMKEKKLSDLMTTTSWSLGVSLASGAAWTDNTTTSNPIPVMDTGTTTIINNSGFAPNLAVIPRAAYISAKNHVSVLDRIKYTSADITPVMMAGLFGLEKVLVPISSYDSAALGAADSITAIFSHVFLGYKPASAGPMKPACGYMFEKSMPRVRRWRDEERKAEAIEVQIKFTPKVVASLTGYLIKGV